jgi:hypothetical protein
MGSSWKGLPGTNTLAYYNNPQLTTVKTFIRLATAEAITIKKLFTVVNNSNSCKQAFQDNDITKLF